MRHLFIAMFLLVALVGAGGASCGYGGSGDNKPSQSLGY